MVAELEVAIVVVVLLSTTTSAGSATLTNHLDFCHHFYYDNYFFGTFIGCPGGLNKSLVCHQGSMCKE